jgi:hypothetical protein
MVVLGSATIAVALVLRHENALQVRRATGEGTFVFAQALLGDSDSSATKKSPYRWIRISGAGAVKI